MIIIAGLFAVATIATVLVLALKRKRTKAPGRSQTVLATSLRDEKLKSEIILNAIEDGVMLIDGQKTIQAFNPAAGKITGWAPKEAMGIGYESVMTLVDDKGVKSLAENNPFDQALLTKAIVRNQDIVLATRSKATLSLDITVSPLLDSEGNMQGAVAVFRDISAEKQEGKQRAEFVSTASHEMRTPVAAIEGYLALALNEKVSTIDSKARNFLEKAPREYAALRAIISGFAYQR